MKRALRALLLTALFLSSIIITSARCETVRYDFDSSSSKIVFHGRSTLHAFEGIVEEVSGFAGGDTQYIERSSNGEFHVKVESMKCESEKMNKNMLEDLESEKFPSIDFVLSDTSVLKSPDEEKQYYLASITGNLSIHGETKKITFPAEVEMNEKDFNLRATVPLSLADFDIKPKTLLFFIRVKDDITLDINLHGKRNQ